MTIFSKEPREERDVLNKMKISLAVVLCLGVVTISPKVNGDVVVDLFGKIQESAQKIGDDVKIFFQSNKKRDNQNSYDTVKVPKSDGGDSDRIVFDRSEISTQATVTTAKSVSSGTNTTGQDGRENFRGACATGYERTPDGRCKPTF